HIVKENKTLYLELDEVNAIKDKLSNKVYKNLITFLVNTGLRIGECLALTFDDVQGDILTVNKTLLQNHRAVTTTKTASGKRKISLRSEER
ncbi:tyrosine-type recombinase/integrase, partial [Streptococcus danieliae]|nr:tyrosine-type recombinase/integrase [Streptococcus danieliae]